MYLLTNWKTHTHIYTEAWCFVCLLPALLSEGEVQTESLCVCVCVCFQWVGDRQMKKGGDKKEGEKERDVSGKRKHRGV